jgi:uncharacterized protein DUF4186
MKDLDDVFARLQKSDFRRRFRLGKKERQYLDENGMETVLGHAADFIEKRLAPARPYKDGRQTPWRGHPVFIAQHATATCCRSCLEKWHALEKGAQLTTQEQDYVVRVIQHWLSSQLNCDTLNVDGR